MKKTYLVLVLLLMLVFTSSCSYGYNAKIETTQPKDSVTVNSDQKKDTGVDTVIKNKNYKVTEIKTDEHYTYEYTVYDNSGGVMLEDSTVNNPPRFEFLSKDVLQMSVGAGNVTSVYFLNVASREVSPIYYNPKLVDINSGRIVYMDSREEEIILIVSDIFSDSAFYKEFKRDFSPVALPYSDLTEAKFLSSNKLQVTYLTGNNYKEVTETLDLD